jgi:hypothetical protein
MLSGEKPLAARAPLLQSWYGRTTTTSSPYRLYALSNAGSLLALLSYPSLVEPSFAVQVQLQAWSVGFGLFALLCAYCSWSASEGPLRTEPGKPPTALRDVERDLEGEARAADGRRSDVLMWLGLSAAPSVLLLATTQQISQEISVVPFLWILPLAIYLLSFILCFDSDRWYRRPIFAALMPLSCLGAGYALLQRWEISLVAQIAIFSTALFCCCMACHGELARSRPPLQRLTLFYLCVSAGGALGGSFCAVVATQIFTKYWELHVGFAACVFLALVSYHRAPRSELAGGRPRWAWAGLVAASLGLGAVLVVDASSEFEHDAEVVERSRNFYGVLTVYRMEDEVGPFYALDHGRIRHGTQYLDPVRRRQPSSYYHPETGVGLAMRHHPARRGAASGSRSLRIGVVGLGAGSLAVYADEGDALRFYEINPEVIRMAQERFTYLEDTRSDVTLVLSDARVEMERELAEGENQNFDVLVVDAFSSDAVPMHLMTREGFELYWEHLKRDGVLVVQITNVYLDLAALVRGTARLLGYEALWVEWNPRGMTGFEPNAWILVTRNQNILENPIVKRRVTPWSRDPNPDIVWTDDYGALFQVLRD